MFDIVFRGDIAPGHQLPQVKQRLAALFKRTPEQIAPLFSGAPVALKKGVDEQAAAKYKKVLLQAGAIVEVRPAGTLNKPAPKPRPARAQPDISKQQENPDAYKPEPEQVEAQVAGAGGAGLTLAPMEGNLLSDSERDAARPAPVAVAELDATLRPAGQALLDENEIESAPPAEVPDLDFDLAEVGADIIDAAYKKTQPTAPVAPLEADLAPVGSDLGQVKASPVPPPPDTSAISLAE